MWSPLPQGLLHGAMVELVNTGLAWVPLLKDPANMYRGGVKSAGQADCSSRGADGGTQLLTGLLTLARHQCRGN